MSKISITFAVALLVISTTGCALVSNGGQTRTPTITSVSPSTATAGSTGMIVSINGSNFSSGLIVLVNGTPHSTTYVNRNQMRVALTATDLAVPTTLSITLQGTTGTSGSGGGGNPHSLSTLSTQTTSATMTPTTTSSVTFTVTAPTPLAVTTTSVPAAVQSTTYGTALAASGGVAPYGWSLTSGALPAGLSLNSGSGMISGTPTAAGSFSFTVQVMDSSTSATTASKQLAIAVSAPAASLSVNTSALLSGTVQSAYIGAVSASGGTSPYSYGLSGGALPPGLALNSSTGTVSGTPTTAGSYTFTVKATDSSSTPTSGTASASLSIAAASSTSGSGTSGSSGSLDLYGGYTAFPSLNGGTGFFRTEKMGNRWMFIDPVGNAFWMKSVYAGNGASSINPSVFQSKYGGSTDLYYASRNSRYLDWGFNTIGEYSSSTGWPVGVYGAQTGATTKLPFNIYFSTVFSALRMPSDVGLTEPVKDIIIGVPTSTYHDFRRPLIDAYAPQFAQAYTSEVAYWNNVVTGGFANSPWVLGLTIEDADDLWGFKADGVAPPGTNNYPNPAFMIANAKFQYTITEAQFGFSGQWQDPKLYSKYAWISFLKAEYTSIGNLNTAWNTGGYYTSFDDVPAAHNNESVYPVGMRTIALYSNMEGVSSTTQDTPCAPRGVGACIGVDVVYNGPCTASTLSVGQAVTVANAIGQGVNGTKVNYSGAFTVTAVLNNTNGHACEFIYAMNTPIYDEGPQNPGAGISPTITFSEKLTTFNFSLQSGPIKPGTVRISIPGGLTATDDGSGHLTGTGIAAGSAVNYAGPVTLNLNAAPAAGTIAASYTGNGYGVGTGVIDEDGRNTAWIGSDPYMMANANPAYQADVNAFLYQFVKTFATVATTAIRAVDHNHLIFGPVSINNYGVKTRNQVLQGLADGGVDVFWFNYQPSNITVPNNTAIASMVGNNTSYDVTGKPAIIWYSTSAQADSAMSSYPMVYAQPDVGLQVNRGGHFTNTDLPNFMNAAGTNGDYYVIGYGWWQLLDNPGEGIDWGLVTLNDNAYDGHEAVITRGPCSGSLQALVCGGEAGNYGDAITGIRTGNNNVLGYLKNQIH